MNVFKKANKGIYNKRGNCLDNCFKAILIPLMMIDSSITHCFSDEHVLLNIVLTEEKMSHHACIPAFYVFGTALNWMRQF